ncbi:MAG: flippase [Metallosphaera sp.]
MEPAYESSNYSAIVQGVRRDLSDTLIEIAEYSARGGFTLFLGEFFSTTILAVASILIARLLGSENYGLYSLSLVVPSLFSSLISLGLDSAAVMLPSKYLAEGKRGHVVSFLKTSIVFRLATGLTASLICFTASDFLATILLNRPDLGFYVRVFSILILFQTFFILVYSFFIGLGSARWASIVKLLMAFFKTFFVTVLLFLGLGVFGALLGHTLGYVFSALAGLTVLFLRYYRRLKNSPADDDGEEVNPGSIGLLRLMLSYGFPLYLSSLLAILLGNYQTVLLAYYASNAEIGSFQAAVNLSTMFTVLITPVTTMLFPVFTRLHSTEDRGELESFLNLSVKYSSLILLPVSVLAVCVSRPLVTVVYGASYSLASGYLAAYSLMFLLVGFGYGILGSFFNGVGKTWLTFRIDLVSLIVFTPLALLLTSLHGVMGLIAALIASRVSSTIYALILARRRLSVKLNPPRIARIYISTLLSAVPTVLVAWFTGLPPLLSLLLDSAVYVLSYMSLTPLLRAVDENDVKNLERMFSGIGVLKPFVRLASGYMRIVLHASSSKRIAKKGE